MTDSWLPTFAAQLLLLVLIVGALSGCLEADPSFHVASVVIAPTDTSIRYIGRTQADGSEAVRFDWAGSGFVVRFAGTGLGVRLDDGANDFNIDLNGVRQPPLATEAGRMAYTLAEGLPDTVHTVRFTRRTEPGLGITTLRGLVLPPGGRLLAPPEAPGRRLLFVGDSITCGYGVEGDRPDCDFSRATEHADAAYAAQAARAFGAEAHLIAQSGLGVVRNYGAPTETSPRPMPSYLDQALFGDEQARWEAAPWRPDAVVINLGTNDFSTT
ncbi:MAG: GDSL-type esterase/lipase family protein, partial [Bacteroidota bacterium]